MYMVDVILYSFLHYYFKYLHHSYEKLIDLKTFGSFGGYDFVLQWWHTVYIQAATFQA